MFSPIFFHDILFVSFSSFFRRWLFFDWDQNSIKNAEIADFFTKPSGNPKSEQQRKFCGKNWWNNLVKTCGEPNKSKMFMILFHEFTNFLFTTYLFSILSDCLSKNYFFVDSWNLCREHLTDSEFSWKYAMYHTYISLVKCIVYKN